MRLTEKVLRLTEGDSRLTEGVLLLSEKVLRLTEKVLRLTDMLTEGDSRLTEGVLLFCFSDTERVLRLTEKGFASHSEGFLSQCDAKSISLHISLRRAVRHFGLVCLFGLVAWYLRPSTSRRSTSTSNQRPPSGEGYRELRRRFLSG